MTDQTHSLNASIESDPLDQLFRDSARFSAVLTELRERISEDSRFLWQRVGPGPQGNELSYYQEVEGGGYLFIKRHGAEARRFELVAGLALGDGQVVKLQDHSGDLSPLFNRLDSKFETLANLGKAIGFETVPYWTKVPVDPGSVHGVVFEYRTVDDWYRFIADDAQAKVVRLNNLGDVAESFGGDLAWRLYQEFLTWSALSAATRGEIEATWRYLVFPEGDSFQRVFVECVLPNSVITVSRQLIMDVILAADDGFSSKGQTGRLTAEFSDKGTIWELARVHAPQSSLAHTNHPRDFLLSESTESLIDGARISKGFTSLTQWLIRNEEGLKRRSAVVNLRRQGQIDQLLSKLELGLIKFKLEIDQAGRESPLVQVQRATGWSYIIDIRDQKYQFIYRGAYGTTIRLSIERPQTQTPTAILSVSPGVEEKRYFEGFQQAQIDFELVRDLFNDLSASFGSQV